jgi:hypothetical protein
MIFTEVSLKRLYEDDYALWLEKNIQLLASRKLKDLDYENLIEELESLGRSERKTAESLVKQLGMKIKLHVHIKTKIGSAGFARRTNFGFC